MIDIISDPGCSVISKLVLSYLDFDTLQVASKVSCSWHEFIMKSRMLWLSHFTNFRKKFKICMDEDDDDVRNFSNEWLEFLVKIENKGTSQELEAISQLLQKYSKIALWQYKPLYIICKFANLCLFKAYMTVTQCNLDLNQHLGMCPIHDQLTQVAQIVNKQLKKM